jgi:hypothetical protein
MSIRTQNRTDQGERNLTAAFISYGKSNLALYTSLSNLAVYFALAIAAFSYGFEHWPITDSLYFATVVFTTVGTSKNDKLLTR